MIPVNQWKNCYDESWKDVIVPEAFAHPAKMSYGLLKRILAHAKEQGWLNGVIVDPFGGIGSTGILGAYEKIKVISVELEPRFTIIGAKNYLLHCQKGWCTCGNDGNAYLQSLQKTISKETESSKCEQKSRDEESVLFDGLSGKVGQGQEIEQTASRKSERENPLEQRQALDDRNESETIPISNGREQSTGEKRPLERREIYREKRICDDKNKREIQSRARSNNAKSSRSEDKTRRNSSSQKRESARQSNREFRNNDNRRASEIPQSGGEKPQIQKETCLNCGKFIVPFPIILQGDSRRLCEVVEKADLIVSSPPYMGQDTNIFATANQGKRTCDLSTEEKAERKAGAMGRSGFRNLRNATPGQLGNMKPGKVDMVISSPPYAECCKSETEDQTNSKQERIARSKTIHDGRNLEKPSPGKAGLGGGYGSTSGNLGNLKSGDVDCVISSPPYEEGIGHGGNPTEVDKEKALHIADSKRYSDTNENLGNQRGDTFWQAAKIIVEQCHQILKPSGHAIWVVKSFVRNKKIVDFPGDWQRLCESVGFKTVCIHHAMLVKEIKNKTLFGHTEVKRKERKSFFRRLAESKGSPRIDYEVILCMEK